MAKDRATREQLWADGEWQVTVEVKHYRGEVSIKKTFKVLGGAKAADKAKEIYDHVRRRNDAERPYSFKSTITPPKDYGRSHELHAEIVNSAHISRPKGVKSPKFW